MTSLKIDKAVEIISKLNIDNKIEILKYLEPDQFDEIMQKLHISDKNKKHIMSFRADILASVSHSQELSSNPNSISVEGHDNEENEISYL